MKKWAEIPSVFFLFCLLEILFWYYALLPGRVLFLKDLFNEMPLRYFWAHAHGIPLWIPYGFFGMPFAANPQVQAFYPLNFLYSLFGAERGLVCFIIFHHSLFLFTFYPAFRRLGFGIEASLISAIGFAFGGFFSSLTILILVLSSIAWFPLVIILLSKAVEGNWLRWSLLLGPVVALQVLGGEIEIAGMSWFLAVIAVAFGPRSEKGLRLLPQALGALGVGIFFGALFSAFQLALAWQMVPLSNRASGLSLKVAAAWSLEFSQLKSIILPNYIIPPDFLGGKYGMDWGLGFPAAFPYFLSFYAGIIILLLALRGVMSRAWTKSLLWLAVAIFSLAMAIGEQLPVYGWLYHWSDWFKLFRLPVKFYFLFNFAIVSLSALGYSALGNKKRLWLGSQLIAIGILLGCMQIFFPIRLPELGSNFAMIEKRMFLHVVFRTFSIFLIGAGVLSLLDAKNRFRMGLLLAAIVYFDLFFAHHWLNPPAAKNPYEASGLLKRFMEQERSRVYPDRIINLPPENEQSGQKAFDPLSEAERLCANLEGFSPIYFGLNTYRAYGTLQPSGILSFDKMLNDSTEVEKFLLFTRAGIDYIFFPGLGFIAVNHAFPRASIFYRGYVLQDQEQVLKIWADPNFPAQKILLFEANSREPGAGREAPASEPAKIIAYENDKVVIEADARQDAWLLLLDAYYPGWKVEADGRPGKVLRADGFFRAARIPAGKHKVVFKFQPDLFRESLGVAALNFSIWLGLLVFSFGKKRQGDKSK